MPKLDDTPKYNCETDCPVCFEEIRTLAVWGDNCEHILCIDCHNKIVDTTNKCPICRKVRDGGVMENDEDDEDDESDESEMIWGNNDRPTTDLFYGRRWYNHEEGIIETYNGTEWRTNTNQMSMSNFIIRYSYNDSNDSAPLLRDDGSCCLVCGIQRTPEIYEYMNTMFPNGYIFPANQITDEGFQTNYFDGDSGEPNIRCYHCEYKFHLLQGSWISMM
jgi:hypothetical protein